MFACIAKMTSVPAGEEGARAASWLAKHLDAGRQLVDMDRARLRQDPHVGALTAVPGTAEPRLRVVSALSKSEVSLWEFDGERTFERRRGAFN